MYCLRCLIKNDIPLNQGCLASVRIIIPENSILSPNKKAAVVGGNVLTSQRICDVIFKAIKACAASQGCCNNLTFGSEVSKQLKTDRWFNKGLRGKAWGYYETIGGGAGAGPNFHGADGIHTHMTNTRITDPEILERRYPVVLKKFEIRLNSGGLGKFNGGNGLIRELMFMDYIMVSILSERRVFHPYGLFGAKDGEKGRNWFIDNKNKIKWNLGSKNTLVCQPMDIVIIETPGGGGYGAK